LRFLADVMGEDRVMLGSDYPFPLGEEIVGELIRTAPGFSAAAKAQLLGGNAERFLGIGEA
jgi:aminocarboxymuconate-semialdehyde decarboxylase